jgi:hypothetical protein
MAIWAKVDNNNIVENILEFEPGDTPQMELPEGWQWVGDDETTKNSPVIGWTWDSAKSGFIGPKPFNSWILDEQTCNWIAPVSIPNQIKTVPMEINGQTMNIRTEWKWNEENQVWE